MDEIITNKHDEIINDGLGTGKMDTKNEKQVENPLSKKSTEPQEDKTHDSMTKNLEDVQKLGKEMENMKTKKELKKEGLISDPVQE